MAQHTRKDGLKLVRKSVKQADNLETMSMMQGIWLGDDYPNQECQVHEPNGVVHYYDDEGVEVETFIPGEGC